MKGRRTWIVGSLGWCVLIAISVALLVENLDGYHNHLGGDYSVSGPTMNWAHGWPLGFMARHSCKLNVAFPWPSYSRWPIDRAPAILVSWEYFAIDLLVAVSIIGGSAVAIRRWRRRWDDRPVFSTRAALLFFSIAVVATVYLQGLIQRDQRLLSERIQMASSNKINSAEDLTSMPLRFHTHYVAQGLICVGVGLAVIGWLSLVGKALSPLRKVATARTALIADGEM